MYDVRRLFRYPRNSIMYKKWWSECRSPYWSAVLSSIVEPSFLSVCVPFKHSFTFQFRFTDQRRNSAATYILKILELKFYFFGLLSRQFLAKLISKYFDLKHSLDWWWEFSFDSVSRRKWWFLWPLFMIKPVWQLQRFFVFSDVFETFHRLVALGA